MHIDLNNLSSPASTPMVITRTPHGGSNPANTSISSVGVTCVPIDSTIPALISVVCVVTNDTTVGKHFTDCALTDNLISIFICVTVECAITDDAITLTTFLSVNCVVRSDKMPAAINNLISIFTATLVCCAVTNPADIYSS